MTYGWIEEYSSLFMMLFFAGCFAVLLIRQYFINKAPTYTAAATVLSRRLGTARYHGKYSSGYNHLVTFQLGGQDTVELYVSREQYAWLQEGLRGQLVWQNENLLRFETDEN